MATIGNTTGTAGSAALNSGNAISGMLVSSWPENGDVTGLRIRLADSGGAGDTFQAAIYSGNSRIGQSNARTDIGTEAEYEFTFSPAVSLTASTEYRFIVGSDSASGAVYHTQATTNYPTTRSTGSAGIPPATNSGGWETPGTWVSMIVDYTVGSGTAVPVFKHIYDLNG